MILRIIFDWRCSMWLMTSMAVEAIELWDVETFLDKRLTDGGEAVSLTRRPHSPPPRGGGGGGGGGGLRLRAPGFGSGRAQLRASAPVWNGHAGRACSRVSPTRLTHYRTLVVSDLQTFPHPTSSFCNNFRKFVRLQHEMCTLYSLSFTTWKQYFLIHAVLMDWWQHLRVTHGQEPQLESMLRHEYSMMCIVLFS
jgi:hypothetical protein